MIHLTDYEIISDDIGGYRLEVYYISDDSKFTFYANKNLDWVSNTMSEDTLRSATTGYLLRFLKNLLLRLDQKAGDM